MQALGLYRVLTLATYLRILRNCLVKKPHLFTIVHLLSTFVGVRCPLSAMIYMVHSWSSHRVVGEASIDAKIGKKMGINIYQWCRDICSWMLITMILLYSWVDQELLFRSMNQSSLNKEK